MGGGEENCLSFPSPVRLLLPTDGTVSASASFAVDVYIIGSGGFACCCLAVGSNLSWARNWLWMSKMGGEKTKIRGADNSGAACAL
jgi:hypothetical protein